MLYIRGIALNKQDAQGAPSACRSAQAQRQFGLLDAIS
jgi:hypothetical protein